MDEPASELQTAPDHRSGFVAVVGRPNVGKSSLMNAWLGQKIAIVSPKPQTTRQRLLGIYTSADAQVIFMDTPGIHDPRHRLGEAMVETALRTIADADLVLFVLDASEPPTADDRIVAAAIRRSRRETPVVMALNKKDRLPAGARTDTEAYLALLPTAVWLPISATRGDGCEALLRLIIDRLPPGPRYYPADQVTDQQERFIAAELIREAALTRLHQEVPHAVAVVTEEFKPRGPDMTYIRATMYVERDSQKRILIGQGGRTLKDIGQAARTEIEKMVGSRVYLELWVKVRSKWRENEDDLRLLGYRSAV
jgi:GTP-binding protein Era